MVRREMDFGALRREYEGTQKTLKQLARENGMRESTLAARALSEGWRRGEAGEEKLSGLKRAADMAAEAIVRFMEDEDQFCRHAYADKTSGEILETTLQLRNVKQLRETIGAIRELTDAMRGLYGLLTPQEKADMDAQTKKLSLEEKKLSLGARDADGPETGVVLLPPAREDTDA